MVITKVCSGVFVESASWHVTLEPFNSSFDILLISIVDISGNTPMSEFFEKSNVVKFIDCLDKSVPFMVLVEISRMTGGI